MNSVNIILAAYNGSEYIEEMIRSCMKQGYKNWNLYVYDDCSTDNTAEIVRRLMEEDPRIHYERNAVNMGSTRNFLNGVLSSPAADYYMFADQDDVWMKDKIDLSMKAMKKLEKKRVKYKRPKDKRSKDIPALVFTDALLVDKDLNYISNSFFKTNHMKPKHTDIGHMLIENKCIGCTCFFNAALARLITIPAHGVRYHDWWVGLIASSFGKIKFVHFPTLLYRQHENNQVGQEKFNTYLRRRANDTSDISRRLDETFLQAKVFYDTYGTQIKKRKSKVVKAFTDIPSKGFFMRRLSLFRHRFFKSGFVRNVGLLLYI